MTRAETSLHSVTSSARHLGAVSFMVLVAVLAIQAATDLLPERSFGPIDISSNVVASLGFVWSLSQLRSCWRAPAARQAWGAAALGMALLAAGEAGSDFLPMDDMGAISASIAISLAAGFYLFQTCSRYAMRCSVKSAFWVGSLVQIVAHWFAWLAAIQPSPDRALLLQYMNEGTELIAALTYIVALLLAAYAPIKSYRFPAEKVGRKGRALFRDFHLRNGGRYPTRIPLFHQPIVRQIVLVAMALLFGTWVGPKVKRAGGPCLFRQALDLARLAVEGIDAYSYYILSLYKGLGLRRHDAFVTRVETKNGLMDALNRTARPRAGARDMSDKIAFARICEAHRVPAVPILGTASGGIFESWARPAEFDRDLFVKDRRGRGASFALSFERVAELTWRDDYGALLDYSTLQARLAATARPHGVIVQPKLKNHPSVAFLAETSLVVFRTVTCLDDAAEPQLTHGLVRILPGFEKSWPTFSVREWGAAIDLETGKLGALLGDSAFSCIERYAHHPITGKPVCGVAIPEWNDIARVSIQAHRVFAKRLIIGWDIGLTPEGPLILEGNSNMDFAFIQRCYETPIGLSPLGPLMNRHLDRMIEVCADRLADERGSTRNLAL